MATLVEDQQGNVSIVTQNNPRAIPVSSATAVAPLGPVVTPAFPATTVVVQNTTGRVIQAIITNGAAAITQVTINGIATGLNIAISSWGVVIIPVGGSIALTYASGAPTWVWIAIA